MSEMSSRRKSVINVSKSVRRDHDEDLSAVFELERLQQETTLVLQDIDLNLSRANAVINDKMFPVLKRYAMSTNMAWESVAFWKSFMEEAADVEVKTSNDTVIPGKDSPKAKSTAGSPTTKKGVQAVCDSSIVSDETSSSLRQIQASTPQQHRSRASLLASRGINSPPVSRRASAGTQRHDLTSSNRNTPRKYQSENEARRSSLVYKHLNSSPTYPEPPILMSDVGKFQVGSSSSAVKVSKNARGLTSSDRDDWDVSRLSPVLFPSLTLTPVTGNPDGPQDGSARKSTNTPVHDSSFFINKANRRPLVSPMRIQYDLRDDISMPHVPTITATAINDSEELVAPQLTSLQLKSKKRKLGDETNVEIKRQFLNTEEGNVFIDQSNAKMNSSTIYHTFAHEPSKEGCVPAEPNSQSISELFQSIVLPEAAREPPESTNQTINEPKSDLQSRTNTKDS